MQLRERRRGKTMAGAASPEDISDDSSAGGSIAVAVKPARRGGAREARNRKVVSKTAKNGGGDSSDSDAFQSTRTRARIGAKAGQERTGRIARGGRRVDYREVSSSSSSSSDEEAEDDIVAPDSEDDLRVVPDSNASSDDAGDDRGGAKKDSKKQAGKNTKGETKKARKVGKDTKKEVEKEAKPPSGRPRRACAAARVSGRGTVERFRRGKTISSSSDSESSVVELEKEEEEEETKQAAPPSPTYAVTMFGLEVDGSIRPVAKTVKQPEKILAVKDRSTAAAVYCVKESGKSYRNAANATEMALLKHCPQLLRSFHKRMDALGRIDGHLGAIETGPAFDPQYLVVDRIISIEHRGRVKKVYVKWKGLSYTDATWESEESMRAEKDALARFRAYAQGKPRNISTGFKDGRHLRDYQKNGVAWLNQNFQLKVNCILADEMGLGKTIQSVAMLESLRYKKRIEGPFLVVAPVSTLGHWQREIESLTDMNCVVYAGSQEDRTLIQQYEFWNSRGNPKFTVLLSSFEIVMKDRSFLEKVSWQYCVIDEAHRLKSKESKTANALASMHVRPGGLLLLTGTPIQNNTKELFSLLSFLDPDEFNSEDSFMDKYGIIKNVEQVKDLQDNILRPRLLRRMKDDVEKSIPLKEETIIWVELAKEQRSYYRAIYENRIHDLMKGSQVSNVPNLRNMAMELRKLCNHPFLCDGLEEDFVSKCSNASTVSNLIQSSGKMVLLNKLLPMLRDSNRRVLIFSQFTIMLDLLEDYLSSEGYSFERIDGKIRGSDRQAAIDRYSAHDSKTFAFLLSTRAGGLGITLTAADTCIIYDSDWNPQNDLQAMARCHRIGQTKDVRIYRLITRNTYEQHLFECSSRKYGLDEAVLGRFEEDQPDVNKNIESLLRHGAYDILKEDGEEDAAAFRSENIDQILQQRTQQRTIGGRGNNTFSVATFVSLEDPVADSSQELDKVGAEEFWKNFMPEACKPKEIAANANVCLDGPRRRRVIYTEKDHVSSSDNDDISDGCDDYENSETDEDRDRRWSADDIKRIEASLSVYGAPRRDELFQDRDSLEVEDVTEAVLQQCRYVVMKREKPDSIVAPPLLPPNAEKALKSSAFMRRLEKNAAKYLELVHERQIIAKALQLKDLRLGMSISKKLPTWWSEQEDLDLLKGVHRHGHKAFKAIRADSSLCFTSMTNELPTDAVLLGRVKRLLKILPSQEEASRYPVAVSSQALATVQDLNQSNRHKRIFSERPDDIEQFSDGAASGDKSSSPSKRIRLTPVIKVVRKQAKPSPKKASSSNKENEAPVPGSRGKKATSPPTGGKQRSLLGYFTPSRTKQYES